MNKMLLQAVALALAALSFAGHAADARRQAEVAQRGAHVMPFSLAATRHVFTKTRDGGTERVVARKKGDRDQIRLIREHLREIHAQFGKGDFSGPSHIHGDAMPGLKELKAAAPGQVKIAYRDVPGGAELRFRSRDPRLVAALHRWFEAQRSDHGAHAMPGHSHHHGSAPAR